MAENQERRDGRWTISKAVAPEEKGKSIAEEAPQKVFLTIPDESEEEFECYYREFEPNILSFLGV